MSITPRFGRLLTAMVTPMHKDGSIDYEKAAQVANYLLDHGSDGLVVAGSTGEAPTTTCEEKIELFKTIVETVNGRGSVIAGTGYNDTRSSAELTEQVSALGVDGVMLVGPYYNKPTQEGFYQHFKTIAECTDLPIILYNVPGRTATNILPETVLRLSGIKNIVALKESTGNMDQVTELIKILPKDFTVYSGDDSMTLPMMAIGAQGVISVVAHIAGNQMKALIDNFVAGNIDEARRIHLALMDITKAMFMVSNPIPVKTAFSLNAFDVGPLRLPLTELSMNDRVSLTQKLKAFREECADGKING